MILKNRLKLKPLAFRISLFLLSLTWLVTWGGVGGCDGCGGGAATPIVLPAPTADVEGASSSLVVVCDTIAGAPPGAFVLIRSDPTGELLREGPLAEDGSFSIEVPVQVGEAITVEIVDGAGVTISGVQTISRDVDDRTDRCPDPFTESVL